MSLQFRVENCLFEYGEHRVPLLSGEFHYWRVLKENWPAIIAKIKEMGVKVVASYVPWNYHELAPGDFDFTGRTSPQRDLAGFLDLLRDEGLYVIIRPGPYIYSEWIHGGPPERAVKHDRMSPEFLVMAREYILAVSAVLAPRQITRDGTIILCQSDNEPYPPIESFGDEIGCFKQPGMFKDWLREKYSNDLPALNRRWRTEFADFDDACFYFHEVCVNTDLPMAQRLFPQRETHLRYADGFEFIGWYAAEVVRTIGGYLREGGIEVPIFANSWSPLYADFTQFCKVAVLAGTDIYPSPFMEGSYSGKDDWLYNVDILKMSEADVTNGNVWSAEFQSGLYAIAQGYLEPRHFKLVALALMARGLKGWNWYMLVNRDNWYNCPINEWGRENEYFPVYCETVATAGRIEPWHCDVLYDLALCTYKPHRVIAPGNTIETLEALETADVSYRYYNPQSDNAPGCRVMLYAGADWIDAQSAKKLEAFVRGGGTLVAFNRMPVEDEYGEPLEGLPFRKPEGARPTNLPVTVSYRNGAVTLTKGGHIGRKVNFAYFRDVDGEPITLTLSTQSKEALVDIGATAATLFNIGYVKPLGKGRVVFLGSHPSPDLLHLVLEQEGVAAHVRSPDVKVSTSVLRHKQDGRLAVFAVNRGDEPRTVRACLNLDRLGIGAERSYSVEDPATGETRSCLGRELRELSVATLGHDVAVRIIRRA